MNAKDISAIIRANIAVQPHDAVLPAIEDYISKQPSGEKHFCTVTGIDRATGEILKLLGKAA